MVKGIRPSADECRETAYGFLQDLNFKVPLDILVEETSMRLYGCQSTVKSGFHSASSPNERGFISLVSNSHTSTGDVYSSLRKEVCGHYFLNTYPLSQKLSLLDRIISDKEEATIASLWAKTEILHPSFNDRQRAEEVFALAAQNLTLESMSSGAESSILDRPSEQLTLKTLIEEARYLGIGVKQGHRFQHTYPTREHYEKEFSVTKASNLEMGRIAGKIREWGVNRRLNQSQSASIGPNGN